MTFAGLAQAHSNVCSNPYHAEDICPADLNRQSRQPQTVCYDFNNSSGCRHRNCSYPDAAALPVPTPPRNAPSHSPAVRTRALDPATVARSKVEQQWHNHKPVVSLPIGIYHLELELATHPDRNFVYNLLSTLKEGACIGYTGPRSDQVSRTLFRQHSTPT